MDLGNESGAAAPRLRRRPRAALEVVVVEWGQPAKLLSTTAETGGGFRGRAGHCPPGGGSVGFATQCNAMQGFVLLCLAMPCAAMLCDAMQC